MKLRKFLAAATALTLLLGIAATPEVGSEIKLALTVHAESSEIPIDEEHFPDENFREYVKEFDTDENGSFSSEEIQAVTEISCADLNIFSLEGIGYFTALTVLDCSDNLLLEFDISQNTALTDLNCSFDLLYTLDVSKCTELKSLNCSNNLFDSLDLSKNTALTSLVCEFNSLTSLNVSECTALEKLNCSYNNFTTLDVSKNTALASLVCRFDKLTSLNVSGCTALEKLDCSGNKLTTLDVSKNTILASLDCSSNELTTLDVSKNTILSSLNCSSNELTTLDASKNTMLVSLDCSSNELTTLDVSKNTMLASLYCSSNELTSIDVSKNTLLLYLYCSENQLTSLDVSMNTLLSGLDCHNNQLTSIDVKNNTLLYLLDCYNNQLTSLDLSNNTVLNRIECNNNKLTSLDLSNNTALSRMNCTFNQLTSLDVSNIPGLDLVFKYGEVITPEEQLSTIKYYYNTSVYLTVDKTTQIISDPDKTNDIIDINKNSFPDDNFRAYVLKEIDADADGKLSFKERYSTILINVADSKIRSLEGIAYFPNLCTLNCSENLLTKLDVSKNISLNIIKCNDNQLASLELGKIPLCITLDCSHNSIASLDISNCPCLFIASNVLEASEKDGVMEYGGLLIVDKTTKLITGLEPEEVEIGTAKVSGMKNNTDVDITQMGITFEDENSETYTAEVKSDGKIMLPALPAGVYTVTASLENCPSRDYAVTVEAGKPVELDVELKLYGDVDGDGEASTADLLQINEHVQKLKDLSEEYDKLVADVDGDGLVTTSDLLTINEHVQQLKLMW